MKIKSALKVISARFLDLFGRHGDTVNGPVSNLSQFRITS